MYEEEKKFLERVEERGNPKNKKYPLSEDKLVSIKNEFPSIPADYLAYLQIIGWGEAREGLYAIYAEPTWCHGKANKWVDIPSKIPNYIAFGADSTGGIFAFDSDNDNQIITFDQ